MMLTKVFSVVLIVLLFALGHPADLDHTVQVYSDETHCTEAETYELIGPEYAVEIETSGGDLVIAFLARHWNKDAFPPDYISAWFDVEIDGVRVSDLYDVDGLLVASSDYTLETDTFPAIQVPVAAGEHLVRWLWKTNTGELCLVRGLFTIEEDR